MKAENKFNLANNLTKLKIQNLEKRINNNFYLIIISIIILFLAFGTVNKNLLIISELIFFPTLFRMSYLNHLKNKLK